jgi:hypothetical protein
LKNGHPVVHHISSSIWLGLKPHILKVVENSVWNVGDGKSVNFWTYGCLSRPIVDLPNLPEIFHVALSMKVYAYIHNATWVGFS